MLSLRQIKYTKHIAQGMQKKDAAIAAGYAIKSVYRSLHSLNNSKVVQREIAALMDDGVVKSTGIANKEDRELLWTSIMNDPSFAVGMRLEASKLLGKAQGDFVIAKEVKLTNVNPVVMIPGNTPDEWEKHWEHSNE